MIEIRIRFEYDMAPRKSDRVSPADFVGCASMDELLGELREQAPEPEWSVEPSADDAADLWAAVQALRNQRTPAP